MRKFYSLTPLFCGGITPPHVLDYADAGQDPVSSAANDDWPWPAVDKSAGQDADALPVGDDLLTPPRAQNDNSFSQNYAGAALTPGSTIRENHEAYDQMDQILNDPENLDVIRSNWFMAAKEVTDDNAVGAADEDVVNGWYLHDEDEDFLRYVHHGLAKVNFDNFKQLAQGKEISGLEGRRSQDLDHSLVELEQLHAERLTEQYFKEHPHVDRKAIMERLNQLNLSDRGWLAKRLGNPYIGKALDRHFGQRQYDQEQMDDRITIGKNIVNQIYKERGK